MYTSETSFGLFYVWLGWLGHLPYRNISLILVIMISTTMLSSISLFMRGILFKVHVRGGGGVFGSPSVQQHLISVTEIVLVVVIVVVAFYKGIISACTCVSPSLGLSNQCRHEHELSFKETKQSTLCPTWSCEFDSKYKTTLILFGHPH